MKKLLCLTALLVLILPILTVPIQAAAPQINTFEFSENPVEEGETFSVVASVRDTSKLFLLKNRVNSLPSTDDAILKRKLCNGVCSTSWSFSESDVVGGNSVDAYYFLVAVDNQFATYEHFVNHKDQYNYQVMSRGLIVKPANGGDSDDGDEPNHAPTINTFVANLKEGTAPLDVTFSMRVDDEDNNDLTYIIYTKDGAETGTIEYNDGSYPLTTVKHTYKSPGVYNNIELALYDGKGGQASWTLSHPITVNSYDHEDHGGGGNGGGGAGNGGGGGGAGVSIGEIVLIHKEIELGAGETASLPIEFYNRGNTKSEFTVELASASFGDASITPDEFSLHARQDMRGYIDLEADDDASGRYALEVKLLKDGRVVDTETVYVEVEPGTDWTMFGLIALLIIGLAGVAGLAYLAYDEYHKKQERLAQVKLRKYY